MNFAELLAARMTEMEKIKIRMSLSEDAIVARYYDYRPELSGGHLRGGTVEQGIEEMKQVRDILMGQFAEAGKADTFGKTYAF